MTTAVRTALLDLARSGSLAMNAEAIEPSALAGLRGAWIAEPKYDGARLLVGKDGGRVQVFARSGASHAGKLAAVEADLDRLPDGSWLDCELVAMTVTAEGRVNVEWGASQSIMGSTAPSLAAQNRVTLIAFDLLAYDGHDARSLPFVQRRGFLEQVVERHGFDRIALTPQVEVSEAGYEALLAQGFEGAMVKALDAPYAGGRGRAMLKVKPVHTEDCFITGFQPGKSGFAGMVGAMLLGQLDAEGRVVEVGKCSGFDLATRQAMTADPEAYVGRVVEVAYGERTKDGRMRFPRFARWRTDKTAAECRREG